MLGDHGQPVTMALVTEISVEIAGPALAVGTVAILMRTEFLSES